MTWMLIGGRQVWEQECDPTTWRWLQLIPFNLLRHPTAIPVLDAVSGKMTTRHLAAKVSAEIATAIKAQAQGLTAGDNPATVSSEPASRIKRSGPSERTHLMFKQVMDAFVQLYLDLAQIKPSEEWLRLRLDLTPVKGEPHKRDVRLRISAHEGTLIHDEIEAVMAHVRAAFDAYELPFQTEIQNSGIEVSLLTPIEDDPSVATGPKASVGQSEDNANAKAWLAQGNLAAALAIGDCGYVEGLLAEMSFGGDTLVILEDDTPAIITGYKDPKQGDHGEFIVESALSKSRSTVPGSFGKPNLPNVTIHGINRIVTFDLDDTVRVVKEGLDAKAADDSPGHTEQDVIKFLVMRPGEKD